MTVRPVNMPTVDTRTFVLFAALFGLLTYGFSAANPMLAGDDWPILFSLDLAERYDFGTGRWLAYLLRLPFAGGAFMPVVTLSVMAATLAAAANVIGRTLDLDGRGRVLLAGLMISNPFAIEWVAFNIAHVAGGVSTLLAAWSSRAIVAAWEPPGTPADQETRGLRTALTSAGYDVARGALLLALSAAIYQTAALIVPLVLMLRMLQQPNHSRLTRIIATTAITAASAALLYAVSVRLSWALSGDGPLAIPNYDLSNGYVLSLSALAGRLMETGMIWRDFATGEVHGFVPGLANLLLALCGTGLFVMAARCWKAGVRHGLTGTAIMLGLLAVPFVLFIVRTAYPVRYNTLVPFGMLLFLAPLAATSRWRGPPATGILAVGAVVLAGQTMGHNVTAYARAISLARDSSITGRILDRIEPQLTAQEVSGGVPLHIVGMLDGNALSRPFGDGAAPRRGQVYFTTSIAECSPLTCQPGRLFQSLNMLQIGARYKFAAPADVTAQASAISAAPAWPLQGSVARLGSFWLIKLSQPNAPKLTPTPSP
jgi:MFS family permease